MAWCGLIALYKAFGAADPVSRIMSSLIEQGFDDAIWLGGVGQRYFDVARPPPTVRGSVRHERRKNSS